MPKSKLVTMRLVPWILTPPLKFIYFGEETVLKNSCTCVEYIPISILFYSSLVFQIIKVELIMYDGVSNPWLNLGFWAGLRCGYQLGITI